LFVQELSVISTRFLSQVGTQSLETHLLVCHFHAVNGDHLVICESIEPEYSYSAGKMEASCYRIRTQASGRPVTSIIKEAICFFLCLSVRASLQ